jgi:hypothetical protein
MTRDDRAKCIEAMVEAGPRASTYLNWKKIMTAAFDSLHGIASVNPIEATDEMLNAWHQHDNPCSAWRAMSAAGDLTNPPEGNP